MNLSRSIALVAVLAIAIFPIGARADDKQSFKADSSRFQSLRSFRMQLDSQSPSAGATSEILTYVAPDELRVEVPARKFTAVIIGSFVWLRTGDRTAHWKRVPMAHGADPLAAVHDTIAIAERARGRIITAVGTQSLDGDQMHVYDIAASSRNNSTKSERIWIGVNDGFPHKIVQKDGSYESTATYSKFNARFAVSLEQ